MLLFTFSPFPFSPQICIYFYSLIYSNSYKSVVQDFLNFPSLLLAMEVSVTWHN